MESYAQKTKGRITASKVKAFNKDPLLYDLIYNKFIELDEDDPRYFVTGDAFHYIMEFGSEAFLEKYYIDEGLVVDKIRDILLERKEELDLERYFGLVQGKIKDEITGLKQQKAIDARIDILDNYKKNYPKVIDKYLTLPELRAEYMRIGGHEGKIELTPAEGRDILGMYEAALKQPMWDLGSESIKEERFFAQYRGKLKLSAKPDRIVVENRMGERLSLDVLNSKLLGKQKEERLRIIEEEGLRCVIRDFKTTDDITRLKKEIKYGDVSKDYSLSMSFYYCIIYILYSLESEVYLDVVEKSSPYVTDTIALPNTWLHSCLSSRIIPLLDRIIKCEESGIFPPGTREEWLEDKQLKKYIEHHPDYLQTSPSYLDLDMT